MVVALIVITTIAIFIALIIPNWDLKSFSIYLNRIVTKKLPFKNNICYPKFKIMVIIFCIFFIVDLPVYILFIFYYHSIFFINFCVAYSILKIFVEGTYFIYLIIMDRIYYKKEKMMSDVEINEIIKKIKNKNPNFFI